MLKDENLDTHLLRLIQETCGQSPNTLERQRGLNQLVLLIQKSGKLYQDHHLQRFAQLCDTVSTVSKIILSVL